MLRAAFSPSSYFVHYVSGSLYLLVLALATGYAAVLLVGRSLDRHLVDGAGGFTRDDGVAGGEAVVLAAGPLFALFGGRADGDADTKRHNRAVHVSCVLKRWDGPLDGAVRSGTEYTTVGPYQTLIDALDAAPCDRLFVTAWVDEDEHEDVTFGEFRRLARVQARFLSRNGIVAGDRVVILMPQGVAAMTVFVGAMMLGAVPAFLAYPNFKVEPSKYSLGLAGVTANLAARAVVIDEEFPDELLGHVELRDGSAAATRKAHRAHRRRRSACVRDPLRRPGIHTAFRRYYRAAERRGAHASCGAHPGPPSRPRVADRRLQPIGSIAGFPSITTWD